MAHKCTGWAIVATMERPNKTWYTETITDIDSTTAYYVDDFLTEYCEQKEADQERSKKYMEESDEEIEEEARLKDGDDELSWSK